ncbi:MAG: ADP-ribosylglycohydrolase family protein [Actinobacteria bacterium]|nr:ADP-ribosylglycohydrolase family protein [Actinomycetota bacterium]
MTPTLRERIRGCLLAGAIGDALGAPVEFASLAEIVDRFGPAGLTGYAPAYGRDGGAITDDTQMTLFTAEGLLRARAAGVDAETDAFVQRAYWRWLATQGHEPPAAAGDVRDGWLFDLDDLHRRRGPGTTCLTALVSGQVGAVGRPVNCSKGCGGIMRAAPAGIVATGVAAFDLGVRTAALTHGHPSGYLAAGVHALLVAELLAGAGLDAALDVAVAQLRDQDGHDETLAAIDAARRLAAEGPPTALRLATLGEGWVAEETLAIAVYAALSHPGPHEVVAGLLLAVNHDGDTDSTGSVTGNLLGALHGVPALPRNLLDDLELATVLTTVADDLHAVFHGTAPVPDRYPPR